ncbi:MAG: hypothetical protein WBG32_17260 [Nodosilinea sp.]
MALDGLDRLARSGGGQGDDSELRALQAEYDRLLGMLDELRAIAADPNQLQAAQRFFANAVWKSLILS